MLLKYPKRKIDKILWGNAKVSGQIAGPDAIIK